MTFSKNAKQRLLKIILLFALLFFLSKRLQPDKEKENIEKPFSGEIYITKCDDYGFRPKEVYYLFREIDRLHKELYILEKENKNGGKR